MRQGNGLRVARLPKDVYGQYIYIYTYTYTHTHTFVYVCICVYRVPIERAGDAAGEWAPGGQNTQGRVWTNVGERADRYH